MPDSPVFEWACAVIESGSTLNRTQVRGTLRLALKQAGLDSDNLSPGQLRVIARRVLPSELRLRGVSGHDAICAKLETCPDAVGAADRGALPEAVFRRLGGQQ